MKAKDLIKEWRSNTKSKEIFEELRGQKDGWLSLNTRLTLLVGGVVLGSIVIAFLITKALELVFPASTDLHLFLHLAVFSLAVAMIATTLFSKIFFDPIKDLREGMEKVADGDFDVRLETKSSSHEIKEMIAGFNMMAQELGATEILQTDFVSNVSHEFKTPINAIEGYTTLLQGCENLDSDQQVYVEKILFNTKRLSALVGNILLLSKLENQSIQTNQTRFRLDEQIRQSILALESAWTKKEIEFDVDLDVVEFTGSESLMHQVWDNLISNAIKFSPEGGCVCLRLQKNDTKLVFTISDSGAGLSEETKKHLFDKFYQGDSSHKQEGNGLGLALVKRILTIAGGEITAENSTAGGCVFTVTLNAN